MLQPGFHDVPAGMVATIVTHLEMRAPPHPRSTQQPANTQLTRHDRPDPDWYRALFRRVGAEDWLWFSRLAMSDADLCDILHDPAVQVFSLDLGGTALGLLELDFREANACELAFFGLDRSLIGQGVGGWLMAQATSRAWAQPITRFHVHTCTLDSPQALAFYMRAGFTPVRQQVEIAPDPRLTGLIAPQAAPQIPIFDT